MRFHHGIGMSVLLAVLIIFGTTDRWISAADGFVVIGETGVPDPVIVGETGIDDPVVFGETGIGDPPVVGVTRDGRGGLIIPNPYPPYPPYFPYPQPAPRDSSYERARSINLAGINAYSRGNYHEALRLYHIAKDMGYPAAFTNIGVCYQNGLGVPQNYYEAAKWFYEASVRGHDIGRHYLDNLINAGLVPPPPYSSYPPHYPPPVPTPSPVYAAPPAVGLATPPNIVVGE